MRVWRSYGRKGTQWTKRALFQGADEPQEGGGAAPNMPDVSTPSWGGHFVEPTLDELRRARLAAKA